MNAQNIKWIIRKRRWKNFGSFSVKLSKRNNFPKSKVAWPLSFSRNFTRFQMSITKQKSPYFGTFRKLLATMKIIKNKFSKYQILFIRSSIVRCNGLKLDVAIYFQTFFFCMSVHLCYSYVIDIFQEQDKIREGIILACNISGKRF